MIRRWFFGGMTVWLLCACPPLAHAGFSIAGTRVIYQEADGEATVRLQRVTGEKPVLLQVWLDDGSPDAQPGTQDLPFLLTPAVSRVDPDQTQIIRIWRTRDDVPHDRELLLFFNALEVPSSVDMAAQSWQKAGQNQIQLAMQARMKFFYRPRGLSMQAAQAADLLRFSLDTTDAGRVTEYVRLRVHNPTPYHVTLPSLALYPAHAAPDATPLAKIQETGIAPMVAPFDDLSVPLDGLIPDAAPLNSAPLTPGNVSGAQVRYSVINDQGGINAKQKALDAA